MFTPPGLVSSAAAGSSGSSLTLKQLAIKYIQEDNLDKLKLIMSTEGADLSYIGLHVFKQRESWRLRQSFYLLTSELFTQLGDVAPSSLDDTFEHAKEAFVHHLKDLHAERSIFESDAAAERHARLFTQAWTQYIQLFKAHHLLACDSEKWASIIQKAEEKIVDYREEVGEREYFLRSGRAAIAEEHQVRGVLDLFDILDGPEGDNTALHLALKYKKETIVAWLMSQLSIERDAGSSVQKMLALTNKSGETIASLLGQMPDSDKYRAQLEIYYQSTPLAGQTLALDPPWTDRSVRSRRLSFDGVVPFVLPGASSAESMHHLFGRYRDLLLEVAEPPREPLSAPWSPQRVAVAAVDHGHTVLLDFVLNPDAIAHAAEAIADTTAADLEKRESGGDYPFDLLMLWFTCLELELYKLINACLNPVQEGDEESAFPSISNNDDLARIMSGCFTELSKKAIDLYVQCDEKRRNIYAKHKDALQPILALFLEAFIWREQHLSSGLFSDKDPLATNLRRLETLHQLIAHKEADYLYIRSLYPPHNQGHVLALSNYMQRLLEPTIRTGCRLPIEMDMRAGAVNPELDSLLFPKDSQKASLFATDEYGNNLLHRALFRQDEKICTLLFDLLRQALLTMDERERRHHFDAVNIFYMSMKKIAEHFSMIPQLLQILDLEFDLCPSAMSESDKKLRAMLHDCVNQVPLLIENLKKFVDDVGEYRETVMSVKEEEIAAWEHGSTWERVKFAFYKLVGKDQVKIFRHRQNAFQQLDAIIAWIQVNLKSVPSTDEHAGVRERSASIAEILEQATQMKAQLDAISKEAGHTKGRFSKALEAPASGISAVAPVFKRLATLAQGASPAGGDGRPLTPTAVQSFTPKGALRATLPDAALLEELAAAQQLIAEREAQITQLQLELAALRGAGAGAGAGAGSVSALAWSPEVCVPGGSDKTGPTPD